MIVSLSFPAGSSDTCVCLTHPPTLSTHPPPHPLPTTVNRFSSVLIVLYANQQAASLVVAVMTLWMPRVMWAR